MAKLRILLADDHGIVREGLKRLVEAEADMEVIGEASDGLEALEKAQILGPDVAVLDVSMGNMNGAEAARRIRVVCPQTRILALTVHEDTSYLRELLDAGAAGYVLKRAAADELIRAIRAVASGGVYVDPRIAGKLVNTFGSTKGAHGVTGDLSEREAAVLRFIAQGYTNKEIASQLGLSVKTVETYKARSMDKLGLRSRVDIVRAANERGWLTSA